MAENAHVSPQTLSHRQLAVVRALSSELAGFLNHRSSPSQLGGAGSPRPPLFPLPPPIEAASSCDSDSDSNVLSHSGGKHKMKIRRQRSNGATARLSSQLGPSRVDAPFRPPPIHSMASLEPDFASPPDHSAVPFFPPTLGAFQPPPLVRMPSSSSDLLEPPPQQHARQHGFARGGLHAFAGVPAMSLVAERLYVGDETAAANLHGLRGAGVTHVVNCTAAPNALEGAPGAPAFLQLGLLDSTADLPRMQAVMHVGADFIQQALQGGGTVLVHCHRGISRSATVAIAYLMRATQQPAEQVFEQMRAHRPIVDPNLGYHVALREWERRVLPPAVGRARSAGGATTPVRPLSRAG